MSELSGQVMFARFLGVLFISLGAYIVYRVMRFHHDSNKDKVERSELLRKGRK